MLRVTTRRTRPGETVIRLEGRLSAAETSEVRDAVAACGPGLHPSIDLAGLISVDADGRATLLELREAGCTLFGGSIYIIRLLEEARR